jgi:4'-phosphopantetheinyl transferase EntD
MALFYQHNINEDSRLGIWRIEEPESFFLDKVSLDPAVSHPVKRLQHLAGRWLLPTLYPDFPLDDILIASTRKPFLESEKYHFSISHCGLFAAAIVSRTQRVGIDLERITERIRPIAGKFLNPSERKFLSEDHRRFLEQWGLHQKMDLELLTLIWSAKESLFKWYGQGGLDFRKHMRLSGAILFGEDEWMELPFLFSKNNRIRLSVQARLFGNLALAFVLS